MARLSIAALLVGSIATPAAAQTDSGAEDQRVLATSVVVEPLDGSTLEVDDAVYEGRLTVTGHAAGMAMVEETTVDSYLLGIREVPFSWDMEALKTQAVAARTYLAWTLARGRSSNGRRYDYDICATTACQVYGGLAAVSGPDGDRWRRAVVETGSEILLYRGRPAQALYSSTSSGRTRNVEDVFVGSTPVPYLRAVDSPDEPSPFVEWSFVVPHDVMEALLREAGVLEGRLVGVTTDVVDDGEGPWSVRVVGTDGTVSTDTWSLRSRLNRAAGELFSDEFPVFRPGSDRRYPQTIMSPSYTVTQEYDFVPSTVDRPPALEVRYRVRGGGWGHLVGMSQFGAQAMAAAGESYDDILAHYYGGLRPNDGGDALPEHVKVGLATDRSDVIIEPTGPVRVLLDGVIVADGDLGSWTLTASGDRILVTPPVGLGLPPSVGGWRIDFDDEGKPVSVRVDSATAAEVRIVVTGSRRVLYDSGFDVREAGVVVIDLEQLGIGRQPSLTITVAARSGRGAASDSLRLLSQAE